VGDALYDIIIIGGGPGGVAAAVYAARKKLSTLLITESFGGQSAVSASIENWIGEESITGQELAGKLEAHVRAQQDVRVEIDRVVEAKEAPECTFEISTKRDAAYRSKTLIVASGSRRRRLGVPGEQAFDGKGVAFCSTCDAPLFQGQEVAVVGGGNSAFETVIDLMPYADKIFLLWRDPVEADEVSREKVENASNVSVIGSVEVEKIAGGQAVSGLTYRNTRTGETADLPVAGVFVEIGSVPNSEFLGDLVETNQDGEIVVDHGTARASKDGIFAAGDVTADPFKQNNIAAGDGVRAALSAYYYLLGMEKHSPCAEV
jgi:alkyl hydroperoxide reductase subunit F